MNSRQEKILAYIIEEYTESAIPVGSKMLIEKYQDLSVSPATIRTDMAHLEEEGYLYQPHISSGRIPTDKGYRYFVEGIMKDKNLSVREQRKMQEEVLKLKGQNKRLARTVAKLLSGLSGSLAVSGNLDKEEFYDFGMKTLLTEPEFKEMDEFCRLVDTLDYIDERFEKIIKEVEGGETKIYIGKENPVQEIKNCSMIVSSYNLEGGEKGLLALIGPRRMKYAKNKSLIEYMKKILGSTSAIIIFVSIY